MLNLNIKGSISIVLFNKCFSIISSSKLIFNFLFSLSYRFEIKLNKFLAYEVLILVIYLIYLPHLKSASSLSTILLTSVNAVFPPCTAAKSYY